MLDKKKKLPLRKRIYLKWARSSLVNIHLFFAIVAGLMFAGSIFVWDSRYMKIAYWIIFFTIISFFVHLNQHKLNEFMVINKRTANVPKRQMELINGVFLAFFLFIMIGFMLFVPYFLEQPIWKTISEGFIAVIGAILSVFFPNRPPAAVEKPVAEETGNILDQLPPAAEKAEWVKILVDAIEFILKAAVIFFLIAVACYALYRLYRWISERLPKTPTDEIEFLFPLKDKKAAVIKNVRKEKDKGLWRDFSSNAKVRKIYKKKLKKLETKERKISSQYTPSEIEEKLSLENTPHNKLLHEYYEKARYSGESCTSQELDELKKI